MSARGMIGGGGSVGGRWAMTSSGWRASSFPLPPPQPISSSSSAVELYSRKVFVGGLPIDIGEAEILSTFLRYGQLVVDWPRRTESNFPPRGYVFLVFACEKSVRALVADCHHDQDKYYLFVSSPTMRLKPVQVRPWSLSDADYVIDRCQTLDPRKTVFIGGVPRPLRAMELAVLMEKLYGGVCYAGIDTDPELKYPKGAARVSFSNHLSYIAAIAGKFVKIQHSEADKRVEVKPYVMDDQMCDECLGERCGGRYASYFCAHVSCLQYYCEPCWEAMHTQPTRISHRPMAKLGEQGAKVLDHFQKRSVPAIMSSLAAQQQQSLMGGGVSSSLVVGGRRASSSASCNIDSVLASIANWGFDPSSVVGAPKRCFPPSPPSRIAATTAPATIFPF